MKELQLYIQEEWSTNTELEYFVDESTAKCVSGFWCLSERVMVVRLKGRPEVQNRTSTVKCLVFDSLIQQGLGATQNFWGLSFNSPRHSPAEIPLKECYLPRAHYIGLAMA